VDNSVKLQRLLHQHIVNDAFPDQAPLLGLLGREPFSEQGETTSPRTAEQANEDVRTPHVGNQPQLRAKYLDELRRARRDDEKQD
jgi:hypothetical protein